MPLYDVLEIVFVMLWWVNMQKLIYILCIMPSPCTDNLILKVHQLQLSYYYEEVFMIVYRDCLPVLITKLLAYISCLYTDFVWAENTFIHSHALLQLNKVIDMCKILVLLFCAGVLIPHTSCVQDLRSNVLKFCVDVWDLRFTLFFRNLKEIICSFVPVFWC